MKPRKEKTEKEEKTLLKANTFHYTPGTAKNLTPSPSFSYQIIALLHR